MTYPDLIQSLIRDGYLKHSSIIEAFKKIDRKDFLPSEVQERAYENVALPIGFKQTISQPLVVAFMLELLDVKPGEKVLEIGSGSGWKTAILSELVGDSGQVIAIERIEELKRFAEKNLTHYGYFKKEGRQLILGDGSKGHPESMPFDKITAAAAADILPEIWKEQLKIGGRIVAPVSQSIVMLEKIAQNKFEVKEYIGYNFVPLIKS